MSTHRTRCPCSAKAAARFSVVVVFATPPFWLAKAMTLALPVTSCSDHGRGNPSALPVRARRAVSSRYHLRLARAGAIGCAALLDARTARRINRAHWDALARAHGQDA